MTDYTVPAIIVAAVIVLAIGLMALGWHNRRRRQSGFGPLPAPPAEPGAVLHRDEVLYLATTRADAPLDRIAIAGLGYRARADVSLTASGILLELVGESPFFIATADLTGAGLATWTVDRVVEQDGLVFVRWVLNGTPVDSYLRSSDPAALVAAIDPLLGATRPGTPHGSDRT